jgi:hypothetical protein
MMKHMIILLQLLYACNASGLMSNFSILNSEKMSKIVYLFAHGLRSSYLQSHKLTEGCNPERWIMHKPLASFDFPDAKTEKSICDRKEVNLGQEQDVACLAEAYEKTLLETSPDHGIVLVGISRGSATILNFAAIHKPEKVKAIVVECVFDTLGSVVRHLLRRFYVHWVPFSHKAGTKLVSTHFPLLDCKGMFPLKTVAEIPHTIPVMLVHSVHDNVVPINSSRRLYCQLAKAGHKQVYLLELASGGHGKALAGADGESYQYAVHAFYKRYNLPHNEVWAKKGENLLKCCQPDMKDVVERIKKYKYKAKRSELLLYEEYLKDIEDEIV